MNASNNQEVNTVTWRPHVSQVGSLPRPKSQLSEPNLLTKTSLKHNQFPSNPVGSGHNVSAKPFTSPALVHKQFNSPINLYSNKNIAETIQAHSEILAPGVVGINFMKPDAPVNKESAVYKAILEEEASRNQRRNVAQFGNQYAQQNQAVPSHSESVPVQSASSPFTRDDHRTSPTLQSHSFRRLQQVLGDNDDSPVTKHVEPPVTNSYPSTAPNQVVESNVCSDCGRLIVGIFCKIKNKKLHEECFKCSTCGGSLKNQGYFNINEKLYCELHAQQAASAKSNPSRIVQPNCTTIRPKDNIHISKPASPVMQPNKTNLNIKTAQILQSTSKPGSPVVSAPWVAQETSASSKVNLPSRISSPVNTPNSSSIYKNLNTNLYQSVPHPYPGPGADAYKPAIVSAPKFSWPSKCSNQVQSSETIKTSYSAGPGHSATSMVTNNYSANSYSKQMQQLTNTFETSTKLVDSAPQIKIPPSTLPKPQINSSWLNQTLNKTIGNNLASSTTSHFKQQQQQNLATSGQSSFTGSRPAPRRGRGQLRSQEQGSRVPVCANAGCAQQIRGPFIAALGKTWCPEHFVCAHAQCRRSLQDCGFVEEKGTLYCESCFELHFAPSCNKCNQRIKGDCLIALDKQYHPECFVCAYCKKVFANTSFYLEDGLPYCEKDWNELFTTKCISCNFPIEAGDRWVEALNNNYHSQCFKCTVCGQNLEGQSFYAKGGKPYCKAH